MKDSSPSTEQPRPTQWQLAWLLRAFLGLGLLIAAAVGVGALMATRPKAAGREEKQLIPSVLVVPVEEIAQPRQWLGFGSVRALDEADVPSRLMAVVSKRLVEPGARVKKNELLVELDSADFSQQLLVAKATVQDLEVQAALLKVEQRWLTMAEKLHADNASMARKEVERYRGLAALDASSAQDLDGARGRQVRAELEWNAVKERIQLMPSKVAQNKAKMDSAKATQELRRLDVERCRITSPLTGVVEEVDAHVGGPVQPGERVVRIVNLLRMEIALNLPAAARAEIGLGDPISISLSNHSQKTWSAKIVRISPQDDQQARTMKVYAEVAHAGQARHLLVPGVFVRGVVTGHVSHRRLVLPRRAVRDNRTRVVRNNRVVSVAIDADFSVSSSRPETGLMDDQWVVLSAGEARLKVGEEVVLNYSAKVRDGQEVQAVRAKLPMTDLRP